jgi:hypothetical protein
MPTDGYIPPKSKHRRREQTPVLSVPDLWLKDARELVRFHLKLALNPPSECWPVKDPTKSRVVFAQKDWTLSKLAYCAWRGPIRRHARLIRHEGFCKDPTCINPFHMIAPSEVVTEAIGKALRNEQD